jgi:uncharacterized protein
MYLRPGKPRTENISAGSFSVWLRRTKYAILKQHGMKVKCGSCRGCCTSSYFIHIRPKETRTLARIPKKYLSPAPGLPKGNVLLGYYRNGHCPMFVNNTCSIYEDRPLTCRSYDCRIFAAAGIAAGGKDKARINQRVRRWKFNYPTKRDREEHLAVRMAAKVISRTKPANPSQVALQAISNPTGGQSARQ